MATTAKTPHRGRCSVFEREVELGPPVRAWLSSFCDDVAEELDVGAGVADLVGGVLWPGQDRPPTDATPVVDSLQLLLLGRCATGASEQELREWAPWGWRGLRDRAVEPLLGLGLMVENGGCFYAAEVPENPYEELVAVELKLKAWNRGVAQAGAYRMFADRAWIAVPSDRITPALLDHATHNTVGVLGVDSDRTISEVAPAARRRPLRPKTVALVAQRLLDARNRVQHRPAGSSIC